MHGELLCSLAISGSGRTEELRALSYSSTIVGSAKFGHRLESDGELTRGLGLPKLGAGLRARTHKLSGAIDPQN